MRKRIAVLLSQADESLQRKFLTGFIRLAYSYDYDVCVFSMYQKYQETPLRDIGDSNIFELVNYKLFDAVVILADTILSPGVWEALEEKVHDNFDGPTIVIDKESKYFKTIMMDHYSPCRKIVDHLIEVHNYRDIAFLGGKEGHPHSVQRYNAFLDSMEAHGLSVNEKWVYHGNYWYDSAEKFADILLSDRDNMPRVIACASDIMAIGVAARLSEFGIKIPEEVAISGYDSIDIGVESPAPLTSASIPAEDCGIYAMRYVNAILNNETIEEFRSNSPIFVGGSCGCEFKIEMVPKALRSEWRTQQSSKSMFSDFDHMLEDFLAQNKLIGFFNTLSYYSYQIKPFYSFEICLNDGFMSPETFVGDKAIRKGYTDAMYSVLKVTDDSSNINFSNRFSRKELTPALKEKRDYPTTFFFNPLYSEDRCFGYSVLNYKDEVKVYPSRQRVWMCDVMQGLEAFYRQRYMYSLVEKIHASQIRDVLTGLYNYTGFLNHAEKIIESSKSNSDNLSIITFDIKGLHNINEFYGRDIGEKSIKTLAYVIGKALYENEIPCRMCSDEFLVLLCDDENLVRTNEIIKIVTTEISNYSPDKDSNQKLEVHYLNLRGSARNIGEFEVLVNQVISLRNHKKNSLSGKTSDNVNLLDEVKRNQMVMDVLNNNLFTYHYQPIINVSDGSIYAYEALMRSEVQKLSPLQIIEAATYLKRLADVEKCTLMNVTSDVTSNIDAFGNAKVFINSLPGINLSEEDELKFANCMFENDGRFVIEFTEESELNDDELSLQKDKYGRYGCQIAIDDYGSGYSNVNNLLRYMPQYVKIDRSLITDIHKNPQKQHFVKSIIKFAHDNGILALAEGVETKSEMYECLRLGVDLIQGYYTGRPQRDPVGKIKSDIISEIEDFWNSNNRWNSI